MLPIGWGFAVFSGAVVATSSVLCSRKKTPSIKEKEPKNTQQMQQEPLKKVVIVENIAEPRPRTSQSSKRSSKRSSSKKRSSGKKSRSSHNEKEPQKKEKRPSKQVLTKRKTKKEKKDEGDAKKKSDSSTIEKPSEQSVLPPITPLEEEEEPKVEEKPLKAPKKKPKKEKARENQKELDQIDLKPKVMPKNAKEEKIAQGQMRGKTDYPTMDDVRSDWDSVRQNTKSRLQEQRKKTKKETLEDDSKEIEFQLKSRANTLGLSEAKKSPAKSLSSEKLPEKAAAGMPDAFKKSKEVADGDSESLEADATQSDE